MERMMKMIIINQDKDLIVNFDNVNAIGLNKDNAAQIVSTTSNGDKQKLGLYESEERAKEVLKEIIKRYNKALITINRGTGQQKFYDLPKVYYMPEK